MHGLIHDGRLRACPSCLLGLMYVLKWLYVIKCLGFQLFGDYIKGQALPFSFSFSRIPLSGELYTWEFHLNLLLCIYFWLISFYLWLVLVFLFDRVSYGFTPLRHCMSRHYTSRQRALCWSYSLGLISCLVCL